MKTKATKQEDRVTTHRGIPAIHVGRSGALEWWCYCEGKTLRQIASDLRAMKTAFRALARNRDKAKAERGRRHASRS